MTITFPPARREMDPIIDDILEPSPVQRLLHGVVLLPGPLPRLAFDGAPGDIIFVGDQPKRLEPNLGVHRRRRLQAISARKSADRRGLDVAHRQVAARNVPGPSVERLGRLREARNDDASKQKQQKPHHGRLVNTRGVSIALNTQRRHPAQRSRNQERTPNFKGIAPATDSTTAGSRRMTGD
jgi:hypothetical protein